MQQTDTAISSMAKAPLDRLLPFSRINWHSAGEAVCTVDQLSEYAFLVLSGRCRETLSSPGADPRILKTFEPGDPIENGVVGLEELSHVSIIAAEESSVLRISRTDLAALVNIGPEPSLPVPAYATLPRTHIPKGRLLTLAFLSQDPPAEAVGTALARSLHQETGESVVLICLVPSTDAATNGHVKPDGVLGQPGWQRLLKNGDGFNQLHIGVPSDSLKDGSIEELTDVLRRRFPYVLVTCATRELPAAAFMRFLGRANSNYVFIQRDSGDLEHLSRLMSALHSRFNGHTHRRVKTVLCLSEGERVGDFDQLLDQVEIPVHSHLRGCVGHSSIFRADIRRMAREISGRLVGLALASGGAKGFAHIGVLQVLEENGIEVDMISGSSMGAYVGSIWAYGASGAEMERLAREMEQRWAIWGLIDPVFPPRRGFLRGAAIKRRLMRTIGESHFGDLLRPMRVVATNLETLDRMVFSRGLVADAVHASIAVPGICVPVVVGEDTFADGGIVDPMPVEVLREAGVNRVIAVNTIPTTERMRLALQSRRTRARENGRHAKENSSKILPFDQHLNYFARGNILEILMRSFLGVQTRMAETACLNADLVLRPDIDDNRWVDFRNPDKYILAGRSIALKQLDEIKALMRISRNGVSHDVEQATSLVAVG